MAVDSRHLQKNFTNEDGASDEWSADEFDDGYQDDIYDCPEQDHSQLAERSEAGDGEEEGDEIYDTPEDAKEILNSSGGFEPGQSGTNSEAGSSQTQSSSISRLKQAFEARGNSHGFNQGSTKNSEQPTAGSEAYDKPKVPYKPKPAARPKPDGIQTNVSSKQNSLKSRWPPPKTSDDSEPANSISEAPRENEKIRQIEHKLAKVFGGNTSFNNNNNNFESSPNSIEKKPIERVKPEMNNAPKIDRSTRPKVTSHSKEISTALESLPKRLPPKPASSSDGGDDVYIMPAAFEEDQYIMPQGNDLNGNDFRCELPATVTGPLHNEPEITNQPQMGFTQRGRSSYADIIVCPQSKTQRNTFGNLETRNVSQRQPPQGQGDPDDNYVVPDQPQWSTESATVEHSKNVPAKRPFTGPRPGSFTSRPLFQQEGLNLKPISPNFSKENAIPGGRSMVSGGIKEQPPIKPNIGNTRPMPPFQKDDQMLQTDDGDLYEVADEGVPPPVPAGRPSFNKPIEPLRMKDQKPIRQSKDNLQTKPSFQKAQPQQQIEEDNMYEVTDREAPPPVPAGRPTFHKPMEPNRMKEQPQIRSSKGNMPSMPPSQMDQPQQQVEDDNLYEIADVEAPPPVPAGRPSFNKTVGTPRQPPMKPNKTNIQTKLPPQSFQPQKQDEGDNMYEITDGEAQPPVPAGRPPFNKPIGPLRMKGKPPIDPSKGNMKTQPPFQTAQLQEQVEDNMYEITDGEAPPPVPGGRPSVGQHADQSRMKGSYPMRPGKSNIVPISSFQKNEMESQSYQEEMYEVAEGEISQPEARGRPSSSVNQTRRLPQDPIGKRGSLKTAKDEKLKIEEQENYEIVEKGQQSSVVDNRFPPDGQENGMNGRMRNNMMCPQNQLLNQVLVGLTNPQGTKPPPREPPKEQKQENPANRRLPPVSSPDQDGPILNMNELQNAISPQRPSLSSRPAATKKPEKSPLEKQPWFHGDLNRQDSESKLKKLSKDGAFVVRNTTKIDGYTISIYYQREVRHLHIIRKNNKFHLGSSEQPFDDVIQLVNNFKANPIELKKGGCTKLTVTVSQR